VHAVIRFIGRWSQTKERVVQLDQKRQEFIAKTKDLPPLSLGGNGQGGIVDTAAAQQPQEVKADGTTH
jgi:hypothetical protein